MRVHTDLVAKQDSLSYVESLIYKLLTSLMASGPLHHVSDVEERVRRLFPYPLDKWAINKANETLIAMKTFKRNKTTEKMPLKMPVERIHQLLQKEVLQHKIDIQVIVVLKCIMIVHSL